MVVVLPSDYQSLYGVSAGVDVKRDALPMNHALPKKPERSQG
jgi:hypothetical protein